MLRLGPTNHFPRHVCLTPLAATVQSIVSFVFPLSLFCPNIVTALDSAEIS